ncbi:MAG: SUMF1/EgtB/PvdO family nonheme iron enzyme [Chthoniobacteraceae bacterium]
MTPNQPATHSSSDPQALSAGRKIGGCYILREDLTRPGGPSVWLASDEVLGKDVTLHFVPPAVAGDAQAMAELRQEVKRNRQLIHPNILRVYDFVEDGSCVAISMDRFDGESLAELLKKKGRLDPDDVKPWAAQLAETLGDAHRIQLFHRDLSPSNLYIRPTGGLLVANFGCSRASLNAVERMGLVAGEEAHMAYLSPQQLDGERPGASDDIYGFGVLLYELLSGKPPFTGSDLVPQIRRSVPAALNDVRAATGATVAIPASWEKLIAACLAKTPEHRPRSLADVVTMLAQDSGGAASRSAAPAVSRAATAEPKSAVPAREEPQASLPATAIPFPPPPPPRSEPEPTERTHRETTASREEKSLVRESGPWKPSKLPANGGKGPQPPEPPAPGTKPGSRKSPTKGALSANYPDLDRPRSKAPLIWLLLAASIIAAGIYFKNLPDQSDEDTDGSVAVIDEPPIDGDKPPGTDTTPPRTKGEPTDVTPLPDPIPIEPPPKTAPPPVVAQTPPLKLAPSGLISSDPKPAPGILPPELVPDSLAGTAGNPPPKPPADTKPVAVATPRPVEKPPVAPAPARKPVTTVALPDAPAPLPPLELPTKATLAQLEEARKERAAAIEKIRQTAEAAATAQTENARRLDAAKTEQDKLQKDLETRRKTLAPVIQQAQSMEIERKKLEDSVLKAEAAATEAANAAAAARRAYEDAVARGGEKLQARQKAELELANASSEIASRKKDIDDLTQLITKADTLQSQLRSAQQGAEQEIQKITASLDLARRGDMAQQRKADREKIAALDKQLQALQGEATRLNAALTPLKELGEVGKDASKKIDERLASTNQQIRDLQGEIKRLSEGESTAPVKETPAVKPPETAQPAAADGVSTNSLGMKFVPVGNVQFSVHLSTRKDFEAFAEATSLKSQAWRNPGFKQDPDHPVVNVTWREAESFCKWLTEKERKSGQLKAGELYRLPTDLEWSKAVGLPAETGSTPEERDMGIQDVYPWGTQWPPPAGAGNFAGEETQTEIPIPNFNDGYPNTSPVGKFRANAAGLYDMGGNVWQWVSDYWNSENRAKALRGGSWYNGAIPLSLLSSCRISSSPDTLHDTYGFRVVKTSEAGKGRKRP